MSTDMSSGATESNNTEPNSSPDAASSADLTPADATPADATPDAMSGSSAEAAIAEEELDRYECRACGYTYEPLKGDGDAVAPGTRFETLDESWRCPVCSASKRQFSNIGPVGNPSGFKENLNYGFGVNTLTPGQKNILIFGGLFLGFLFFLSLYGLK